MAARLFLNALPGAAQQADLFIAPDQLWNFRIPFRAGEKILVRRIMVQAAHLPQLDQTRDAFQLRSFHL